MKIQFLSLAIRHWRRFAAFQAPVPAPTVRRVGGCQVTEWGPK